MADSCAGPTSAPPSGDGGEELSSVRGGMWISRRSSSGCEKGRSAASQLLNADAATAAFTMYGRELT